MPCRALFLRVQQAFQAAVPFCWTFVDWCLMFSGSQPNQLYIWKHAVVPGHLWPLWQVGSRRLGASEGSARHLWLPQLKMITPRWIFQDMPCQVFPAPPNVRVKGSAEFPGCVAMKMLRSWWWRLRGHWLETLQQNVDWQLSEGHRKNLNVVLFWDLWACYLCPCCIRSMITTAGTTLRVLTSLCRWTNIWLKTEKPSSQLIDPSIFCVKLWMAMESDPCIAWRSRTETMESISQVHLASTGSGRLAHEGNIGKSPIFEEIRILNTHQMDSGI